MDRTHVSPIAARIIAKCGGISRTAKLSERSPVTIHKWRRSKADGGTGGLIPAEAQAKLWAAVRRGEVELAADDFLDPETPPDRLQPRT